MIFCLPYLYSRWRSNDCTRCLITPWGLQGKNLDGILIVNNDQESAQSFSYKQDKTMPLLVVLNEIPLLFRF